MNYINCLCLNCARMSGLLLNSAAEAAEKSCPVCGQKRLVPMPSGIFSGGG